MKHSAVQMSMSTSYNESNFNPTSMSESKYYKSFITNTLGKRISIDVANQNEILQYVRDKCSKYSMTILKVPCQGTGRRGLTPNTINGVNVASYNLRDYRDVLDTHQFEVSSTALMEYSGWIHDIDA